MRRFAAAFVATGGLMAGFAGTAEAQAQTGSIQEVLSADGSGSLIVNANNNPPSQTWSWQTCGLTGMPCSPFKAGQQITTDGAPPDVIFRATSNLGTVVDSLPWRGNVTSLTPPSVIGQVRANEFVTPIAGTWSGGWEGDFNRFQLAACRSATGEGCVSITEPKYGGCAADAAVLDPALTGRYLRVANVRLPQGLITTAEAYTSPYGRPIWPANAIVSVAIPGQIAPPAGPRQAPCGPPPLEQGSISTRGVATVSCLLGCRAMLSVRGGKGRAAKARLIASTVAAKKEKPKRRPPGPTYPPSFEVKLSAAALRKLGPGRARFVLRIDGERVARRSVVVRPNN